MNNKTASLIRDYGMNRVFDGIETSEMVQIDSGKFVFPIDVEGVVYWCEVDFIAKKEDYTPDYDVSKYADKVARMEKAEREFKERQAKKNLKKNE